MGMPCRSGEVRDHQENTKIDRLISEHCHRSGSVERDPLLTMINSPKTQSKMPEAGCCIWEKSERPSSPRGRR